jgi:hypothetical protein
MRTRVVNPEESLVTEPDEWGRDPAVRAMRRVFAAIEAAQKELLGNLGLSPLDQRLRRWRERALAAFDASWARSERAGMELNENEAGALYVQCLGKIMLREGVDVPSEILLQGKKFERILREVFP